MRLQGGGLLKFCPKKRAKKPLKEDFWAKKASVYLNFDLVAVKSRAAVCIRGYGNSTHPIICTGKILGLQEVVRIKHHSKKFSA